MLFLSAAGFVGSATVYPKLTVSVSPIHGHTDVHKPNATDGQDGIHYPNRSSWVVTASGAAGGEGVERMLDGLLTTRWSSGKAMAAGDWIAADFGAEVAFDALFMNSGTSWGDYARGYAVYVSNNATDWGAPVKGSAASIVADLGMQRARYVKVVLTVGFDSWWSIAELKVARIRAASD